MLKTVKINKCRLCSNNRLYEIHKFGNLYVSNFVNKNNIKNGLKAPLTLTYCSKCTLLQLAHSAPQELMYRGFYWYRSGVTKSMKSFLKDIYVFSKKFVNLKKDDVILDIGANDGTLLRYFNKNITIGCEPAKNLTSSLKKNCKYVIRNFWDKKHFFKIIKKQKLKKAKIITAIGMFYDLENPNKFISDAAESLTDDGIFIAQLMCLKSMLIKNDVGNICHEHLEFYSFKSLKYLFENNGLKIVHISENEVNGGSFRIVCKKQTKKNLIFKENTSLKYIKNFITRVENNKSKFLKFLHTEISKGKKFIIYGASTKGNTILQYYGINHKLIKYAAERSPEKYGKYTIGTGIEIISEIKARKMKPDYFIVLPYGFINEFIKRERKFLNEGGKLILLIPNFKVISK